MASVELSGIGGQKVKVQTGLFIDNRFVPAHNEATLDLENPSTGKHLATISAAQKEDINKAVASAKTAFQKTWKHTQPTKKGQLLNRLADLIERDIDEFAAIEALDAGILVNTAEGVVSLAISTLRYFAGWADKIDGKYLDTSIGMAYTRREPLGVCATILPWNSPLMLACWKIGPAIALGNVLIIKSPELAPLSIQKLAALTLEAGFPPGVINVVCGFGNVAGSALSEHMEVRKVAFTGSVATGRQILKAAATSNLKKVTLELGGKGPSLVFSDADFENALFWTTMGITMHNGQICAAGSRIYVQAGIYDRFIKAFQERSQAAVHGDPLLATTTKGPIISGEQHKKILGYMESGKKAGVKLLHGGKAIEPEKGGHFVENTAFVDVGEEETIMKEEIFGPVASIAKFSTEAEAIAKANATEYGLAAAVFTENVHRAQRVSAAIEAGTVTVNCWGALEANAPFGGCKQSGFGKDLGEDALDGWCTVKAVKYLVLPDREGEGETNGKTNGA